MNLIFVAAVMLVLYIAYQSMCGAHADARRRTTEGGEAATESAREIQMQEKSGEETV